MLNGTHYFECTCGAPDHTLRFILDTDDELPTIYTEVMMSHYLPWYKRVWVGIKYMFGMDKVDHFGGWELHHDDADRLIAMLEEFKKGSEKYLDEKNSKLHNRAGWIRETNVHNGDGC